MISNVTDYLAARIKARSDMAKHILAELNSEGKLLASDEADLALQGVTRVGDDILATYSGTILAQMGLTEETQAKCNEVAFLTPAVVPLDDIALAVWHWQKQFDGRASVSGVLSHLAEELSELQQSATAYAEDQNMKNRMDASSELADIFVLAFHLAALLNLDPAQCLAEKLRVLQSRDYSGEPDAEGKIKHEEA